VEYENIPLAKESKAYFSIIDPTIMNYELSLDKDSDGTITIDQIILPSSQTTLTIPYQPTNLTSAIVLPTSVNLTWQDNSDNEIGFEIERMKEDEGIFSPIAVQESNVTIYQEKNAVPNTICYYQVRAYNQAGYSSYSKYNNVSYPTYYWHTQCNLFSNSGKYSY
jgi:hypothetical protein